jgi:hypothetical protein
LVGGIKTVVDSELMTFFNEGYLIAAKDRKDRKNETRRINRR